MRKLGFMLMTLLFLLPVIALADAAQLTVTGTATLSLPADAAVLSIGVRTMASTAADASEENAQRMEQLFAALETYGIADEDITTSYYYVNTMYDYSQEGTPISGYQVSNQLSVTVRDIEAAGDVIDLCLKNGANECNGIRYTSSGDADANDEVLKLAVKEGMRKAALMAEAMDRELGDLVSVQESYGSYTGVRYAMATTEDAGSGAATRIAAGDLDFTATVQMVFELK